MAISINYTDRFKKHYKKLNNTTKKQFKNKLELFVEDPMHPSLRAKKIRDTDNLFEFSVNLDIRVIWYYEGDMLVALIDIGHHDILLKY